MRRMTWKGHEFLDAVRHETVWNELKKQAKTKALDLPIGVIVSLEKSIPEKLFF